MKNANSGARAGLAALLLVTSALGTTAMAGDNNPTSTVDASSVKLEFHPLRAAHDKRGGDSLKPPMDIAEFAPVEAELSIHVHKNGNVSYGCSEDHSALKFETKKTEIEVTTQGERS